MPFIATDEQIAEWKKKHGDIFKLTVGDDHVAYMKSPDRKTLSYASIAGKTDPLKFNETLMKSCWLAGDEEIKTDDNLFISAGQVIGSLVSIKEATLEKI